jgi:hypothetical protein
MCTHLHRSHAFSAKNICKLTNFEVSKIVILCVENQHSPAREELAGSDLATRWLPILLYQKCLFPNEYMTRLVRVVPALLL